MISSDINRLSFCLLSQKTPVYEVSGSPKNFFCFSVIKMIENKNVETTATTTVNKEEEKIEMKKQVTITNEIKKGVTYEVINGSHKLAPNATVTGIIPVGTKMASTEAQKAAAAAYASQLNQFADEEFNTLCGKVITGGYITRKVLSKKLLSLGFEVLTQPQKKIDRWGEGQPHGYEKYFKGSYAAQIICGSLEESDLVSRGSGLENMFQINCEITGAQGTLGTGYFYVRAGSRSTVKKVVEAFLSEYYGTDTKVSTKTKSVEHPGIWEIKDSEASRKAVAAAKKNNGVLYTKAAAAELKEQRKLDTLQAELAQRDAKIASLESSVAVLQKAVAELQKAITPEPDDDPKPKDPPSVDPAPAEDEDWGDLDDISTPGYHEDSMMNPNAKPAPAIVENNVNPTKNEKDNWDDLDDIQTPGYHEDSMMNPNATQETPQETPVVTPEPEEPLFHEEEENVKEQDAPKDIIPEININDIILDEESSTLIASFYSFIDISMPGKAVLDYEKEVKKFETERDHRYKLLIAHARALGCTLEELKDAVKKFRPQGLKINDISMKNDGKIYVLANKCGHGGFAWYEVTSESLFFGLRTIKILKDSFIKLTNGVK